MAWDTMHYAVGMGCSGAVVGAACFLMKKGWRWLPAAMTAGGVWAMVPDMPRIFREDFPNAPFAAILGSADLERWLHSIGNLFFFHLRLDMQPHEYALLGFALVLILYNLSIALLIGMEHRQRNSLGNRAWRAHRSQMRHHRRSRHRSHHSHTEDDRPAHIAGRIRSSHLSRVN